MREEEDYDIEIDDSTSSLLDAIANAKDDPLSLATLAEINSDEFRQFMVECGEKSREAAQLLKAAERLEDLQAKKEEPHYRTAERNYMKVFLSWSGQRSKEVAEALMDWLPDVLHTVTPFMSSVDIETGKDFFRILRSELETTNFGVLCLTKDKSNSPWLLFESGALAKVLKDSVLCPYLIDMEPDELPGPLKFFQAAPADEDGTWRLVRSLNTANDLIKLSDQQLRKSFDRWWPDLKPKLESKVKPLGPRTDAQTFYVINVKSATFLRAMGRPHKNGEAVDVSDFSGDEPDIWHLHQVEKKYYAIVSAYSGQCLDVEGNSLGEHVKVHQWEFRNGDNQKWGLLLQKDGSYKLRAKHSRAYLTLTNDGIRQMFEIDSRSQKWWLTPSFD